MVSRASGTWRTSFWLALLLVFGLVTPGLPQDPGDVCDNETAERVVAIADVHGAYAAFRSGDWDSIRDGYYALAMQEAAVAASDSGKKFDERAFRDDFIARTPLGWVEMQFALGPKGEYARWLRQRNTMIRINGV